MTSVRAVRPLLAEAAEPGERPAVVVDDYVLGASLEFLLGDEADVFVLDHDMNRRHGRSPQLRVWGVDTAGLVATRAGDDAAVIVRHDPDGTKTKWMSRVAAVFDSLEPRGLVRIPAPRGPDHDVVMRVFLGRGVR